PLPHPSIWGRSTSATRWGREWGGAVISAGLGYHWVSVAGAVLAACAFVLTLAAPAGEGTAPTPAISA
ncbi:MAG: hypothetical protein ABF535_11175, partial [Acetobacter sp.]